MRISAINNNFKPKFGYDVNLNKELKSKLDNYPDRYWAATLATLKALNQNSFENLDVQYEKLTTENAEISQNYELKIKLFI